MATIRGSHLLNLPRLPDALAEASGFRFPVSQCEPPEPSTAEQFAIAVAVAECLAAIREAKPRLPSGSPLSKRRSQDALRKPL